LLEQKEKGYSFLIIVCNALDSRIIFCTVKPKIQTQDIFFLVCAGHYSSLM